MKLFGAMKIKDNELTIGGIGAKKLAEDYGTPLYIMDENLIRKNCKDYYKSFKCDKNGNKVTYAGKACMTLSICKIIAEEGLHLEMLFLVENCILHIRLGVSNGKNLFSWE